MTSELHTRLKSKQINPIFAHALYKLQVRQESQLGKQPVWVTVLLVTNTSLANSWVENLFELCVKYTHTH